MDHLFKLDADALCQALLVLGMSLIWFYCASGVIINWRSSK